MILYLDTSALVKLYVEEEGARQVRQSVQDAEIVATSEIAYVEVRAAMARRQREGALAAADYRRALRDLRADWSRFFLITVGSRLVFTAGDLAAEHHLRAYDAVHLASGVAVRSQAREPVTFACWARSLAEAASKVGLHSLPLLG